MKETKVGGGVIDWAAFVDILVERLIAGHDYVLKHYPPTTDAFEESHRDRLDIARSLGLKKAFEGLPDECPADDAIRQAVDIITCLGSIKALVKYRAAPATLIDPLKQLAEERRQAIEHLRAAEALLNPLGVVRPVSPTAPDYFVAIYGLIARISVETFPISLPQALARDFDSNNLKRKGRAALATSAFNGWMMRELARHVPKAVPKRATAISELLALVDVHVEATTVTSVLREPPR